MSLIPFCVTDRQRQIVKLYETLGVDRGARELGCNRTTIQKVIRRLKMLAEQRGYSPDHDMTHAVPESYVVKGVSTLYNSDGQVSAQWVKSDVRRDALVQAIRDTVDALKDSIPKAKPVAPPAHTADDLANLYVITDYHLGMRAWPEETRGNPWDTDQAEETLVSWFACAIRQSPNAEVGILAQLGDFLHFDGLNAVTPTGGHILDADTRFQRLIRVSIRVLRRVIGMLLAKHQTVHVVMAEGNHDMASSAWLREVFEAFYLDEPRVTVDVSPDPYYCIEHGDCALFLHHGHLRKQDKSLDKVFASKFRDVFGRTKHAYGHTGHYHSRLEIESELMPIKRHRTLAPNDAYASRNGYNAGRDAQVITYHRKLGEIQTLTISPEAV